MTSSTTVTSCAIPRPLLPGPSLLKRGMLPFFRLFLSDIPPGLSAFAAGRSPEISSHGGLPFVPLLLLFVQRRVGSRPSSPPLFPFRKRRAASFFFLFFPFFLHQIVGSMQGANRCRCVLGMETFPIELPLLPPPSRAKQTTRLPISTLRIASLRSPLPHVYPPPFAGGYIYIFLLLLFSRDIPPSLLSASRGRQRLTRFRWAMAVGGFCPLSS